MDSHYPILESKTVSRGRMQVEAAHQSVGNRCSSSATTCRPRIRISSRGIRITSHGLLVKLNQIARDGTIDAVAMAPTPTYATKISHAGETEYSTIADLALAPCGSDQNRTASRTEIALQFFYLNQLRRIEEELGSHASYAACAIRALAGQHETPSREPPSREKRRLYKVFCYATASARGIRNRSRITDVDLADQGRAEP